MRYMAALCAVLLGLLFSACSGEQVKRTTYETLQNIGEQECEKDLSSECPERQTYDEYRRSQDEAVVRESRPGAASSDRPAGSP